MKKTFFGKTHDSKDVYIYEISDGTLSAHIMTRGATVVRLIHDGMDVVGGFDTVADYEKDTSYQGATIGRVANRIGGACFEIDGKKYVLDKNDGNNCLHGGFNGVSGKVWDVEKSDERSVTMSTSSEDGEGGFPGNVSFRVTFTVSNGALMIEYEAKTDKPTPISMTNHSYFNLKKFGENILTHKAQIFADYVTEVDENLIPTGKRTCVEGTVFDLRTPCDIGAHISDGFDGYDHNFMLSGNEYVSFPPYNLRHAACVRCDERQLDVYTDAEGVQFYIANALGGKPDFKGGVLKIKHGAFCLETQAEPDCVNHGKGILRPDETYRTCTVYKFSSLLN